MSEVAKPDGWGLWIHEHCANLTMPKAWRGVESQYIAATMKLVDSHDEQDMLEQMLEANKPSLPEGSGSKHYLLVTPFRYRPLHDSRFRRAASVNTGVWYGAATLKGACAEVAYWRMRFIQDSVGLARDNEEVLTQHTFFCAAVRGLAINLMTPPWSQFAACWKSSHDYTQTHQLAQTARGAGIAWIQYESVREPDTPCAAVFTPDALSALDSALEQSMQSWMCKTTRDSVWMRNTHSGESFSWME